MIFNKLSPADEVMVNSHEISLLADTLAGRAGDRCFHARIPAAIFRWHRERKSDTGWQRFSPENGVKVAVQNCRHVWRPLNNGNRSRLPEKMRQVFDLRIYRPAGSEAYSHSQTQYRGKPAVHEARRFQNRPLSIS